MLRILGILIGYVFPLPYIIRFRHVGRRRPTTRITMVIVEEGVWHL